MGDLKPSELSFVVLVLILGLILSVSLNIPSDRTINDQIQYSYSEKYERDSEQGPVDIRLEFSLWYGQEEVDIRIRLLVIMENQTRFDKKDIDLKINGIDLIYIQEGAGSLYYEADVDLQLDRFISISTLSISSDIIDTTFEENIRFYHINKLALGITSTIFAIILVVGSLFLGLADRRVKPYTIEKGMYSGLYLRHLVVVFPVMLVFPSSFGSGSPLFVWGSLVQIAWTYLLVLILVFLIPLILDRFLFDFVITGKEDLPRYQKMVDPLWKFSLTAMIVLAVMDLLTFSRMGIFTIIFYIVIHIGHSLSEKFWIRPE